MTQQKNNNINSQPTTIGARIKELRNQRNLTQNGAAMKFHINASSWCRIENGGYEPDVGLIKQICEKWNVSADYLLFGKKDPDNNVINLNGLPYSQIQALRGLVDTMRPRSC